MKFTVFFVLLGSIFYMGYQTLGVLWNPSAIRKNNEAFLESVKEQQFEQAAKLFDGSIENDNWLSDVQRLHEDGHFKLLSYGNVKAEFDDGSFSTGHADLTFEINGQTISTSAILTFGHGGMPKQVCAITPPAFKQGELPELDEWNQIMCGGSF